MVHWGAGNGKGEESKPPQDMAAKSSTAKAETPHSHKPVALQADQVAAHCCPIEHDGLSMTELVEAMKKDAMNQEKLVQIIADLVQETVLRNDRRGRSSTLLMFEGSKAPIPATAYIQRIKKYGGCSECCFAVALIYLERLKHWEPSVCLTSKNFQRLILVSVMIASKYLDDFYYSNKHWAEIGGMSTAELNGLELEFLFRIAFSCSIQRKDYDIMCSQLLQYLPSTQSASIDPPTADIGAIALRGNDAPAGHDATATAQSSSGSGYKSSRTKTSRKGADESARSSISPTTDIREGRARSPESRVGTPPDTTTENPAEDEEIAERSRAEGIRSGEESRQMAIDAF